MPYHCGSVSLDINYEGEETEWVRPPGVDAKQRKKVTKDTFRPRENYQVQNPKLPTQLPNFDSRIPMYKTYHMYDVTGVI